jgi:hypothetical protein
MRLFIVYFKGFTCRKLPDSVFVIYAELAGEAKMLLNILLTCHVFEVNFILRVTDGVVIGGEGARLV